MEDKFIIPLNGLASGVNEFHWDAGVEFFKSFENEEIIDSAFSVDCDAVKTGREVAVDCRIEGKVTVLCDRCMEELELPVDAEASLMVMYGKEEGKAIEENEDDLEVVYVQDGETDLDLSQVVYDYLLLSLPMQRFHAEGECNPEVLKRLDSGVRTTQNNDGQPEENPFASLQGLFSNKN